MREKRKRRPPASQPVSSTGPSQTGDRARSCKALPHRNTVQKIDKSSKAGGSKAFTTAPLVTAPFRWDGEHSGGPRVNSCRPFRQLLLSFAFSRPAAALAPQPDTSNQLKTAQIMRLNSMIITRIQQCKTCLEGPVSCPIFLAYLGAPITVRNIHNILQPDMASAIDIVIDQHEAVATQTCFCTAHQPALPA